MKAALYARVSSEKQEVDLSISAQFKALREYAAKYGQDNAKYLMEVEQSWTTAYKLATYVDWDWPEAAQQKEFTRRCAEEMGWDYEELLGDSGLLQRLLDGDWCPEEVFVLEPGEVAG